jgi:hypothetical protein
MCVNVVNQDRIATDVSKLKQFLRVAGILILAIVALGAYLGARDFADLRRRRTRFLQPRSQTGTMCWRILRRFS